MPQEKCIFNMLEGIQRNVLTNLKRAQKDSGDLHFVMSLETVH